MNRFKNLSQYSKAIFYCGLGLLCILPSVYITRFSYPAQDDFFYAKKASDLMNEGYGHIRLAFYMVEQWHQTWGGLYSSTFLGFFFSGYALAGIHMIRIIEFASAVIYVCSLFLFSYILSHKICKLDKKETLTIFGFIGMFLFGVVYYGDFDVFYWFITSVQYLMLMTSMITGISLYVMAIHQNNKKIKWLLIIISVICALTSAGANLALSGLNLMAYLIVDLYYCIVSVEKKEKKVLFIPVFPLIGSLINGSAPGNYVRAGGGKSFVDLVVATKSSIRFVLERIESYIKKPEFWIVFLALILATLFVKRTDKKIGFKVRCPILISLVSVAICVAAIFPAMLGYGYEVFCLLIRCQVILDLVFFWLLVINILLYEQWLWDKFDEKSILHVKKGLTICMLTVIALMAFMERDNNWRWIGVCRNYRDLDAGRFEKYADYYIDILHQVEESEEKLVILYVDEVEEKTSQISPIIVYDTCYDPEGYGPNDAIADFYDKEGLWVLHRDYYPTEEDILLAKKYGIDEWPDSE